MRRTSVFLLFLLLAVPVVADAEEPAPPSRPRTDEQAADAVLAAVKAKDAAALRAVAEQDQPDPWLVADLLCYRGEHDAAEAFAKAAPREDTKELPAYVEAWRTRKPDKAERELRAAMLGAMRVGKPQEVIEGTASLPAMDTVLRIHLGLIRGVALRSLRRFGECADTLEHAAASAKEMGWLQVAASLYAAAGGSAKQGGAWVRALSSYVAARALNEERGNRVGVAGALMNIGEVHVRLGDQRKALAAYEQALAECTALGDRHGAARVLQAIGGVHTGLGDYQQALATLERALAAQQGMGDERGAASVRGQIGIVFKNLGSYAKALTTFEQVFAEAKARGDKGGAATALGNIGVIHADLGDYTKALTFYEQSLAESMAQGNRSGAAVTLGNIANVHMSRRDYAKALATYEQALAEQRALGEEARATVTLGNMGGACQSLGDHARALAIYEQALAASKSMGDKRTAALALTNIGLAYQGLGDNPKALAAFKRSAEEARSIRATPVFVMAQVDLARLHLLMGKPARALAAVREALDVLEDLLGGLGVEQGATARAQYSSLFGIGVLAAVREEDAAQAVRFLESGRAGALLDTLDKREALRWKTESLSPELRQADLTARAAETAARHAYDRAATREGSLKERRAAGAALDRATEEVREVASRIQRALKQQAGLFYPRPKTIYDIRDALGNDQALVLYGFFLDDANGLDEALALVLRPDGERVVSLGKVSDIAAACEALDATDPSVDQTVALDAMRKLLVDPLQLGEGVKQVLVCPQGPLCYVPFGALFAQTIALTPSGTTHLLLLGEEREPGKGILALGAPDYGGVSKGAQATYYRGRTLSPLPATRKEVETIGTKRLLGAAASEAGLREALPMSKRWRAVHFACHGLVDIDRPMLSSLALSNVGEGDGFLTALEVLRMKIPADLAVLSACETATGKIVQGEGIVGLTRAFMFAGTPRVICSLWNVDDEATQALMIKFYELWNPKEGKGLGAAAALQQAQAFIRGQDRWKHPYYWAAWVLWGLPD